MSVACCYFVIEFWHNLLSKPSMWWGETHQIILSGGPAPVHHSHRLLLPLCLFLSSIQRGLHAAHPHRDLPSSGTRVAALPDTYFQCFCSYDIRGKFCKMPVLHITALTNINHFRHEPHLIYSPIWGSVIIIFFYKGQPRISWIFNISQKPQGKTAEMLGIPLNAIKQFGGSNYLMVSVFNICAAF